MFSGRTGLSGGWGRREGSCGWGGGEEVMGGRRSETPPDPNPPPKETP